MVYPFQTQAYRSLFKKHFVPDLSSCVIIGQTEYELLADGRVLFVGMKPVLNGQEITDYGNIDNPTNEQEMSHITDLNKQHGATSIQFDYVREDSNLFSVLSDLCSTPPTQQEVAPFISLPPTWEEYLESLERTDRKELKRKINRLATVPHTFRFIDKSKIEDEFELFISLHKLSDHSKDLFMTVPMKSFFKELYETQLPGWQQKLAFLSIEDKPAAAVLYFENESELLLYNSGYDPEQKYYSAGLLLVAELIKKSIEEKKKVFDFLRGNERYKYDLGGKDMNLFQFIYHFTKSTSA